MTRIFISYRPIMWVTESLRPPCKVSIIGPIVLKGNLRFREVKSSASSHTATGQQIRGSIRVATEAGGGNGKRP